MNLLEVISEPRRREILARLGELGESPVGELAETIDVSRPAVSQHLKVLRNAGIVTARVDAQRRIYRLNDDSLDEVEEWLGKVREFWSQRLDRLEQLLSETD